MDNDKQVRDIVQQTTRDRFLDQPLQADEREAAFDLEREFAKSAKNRSLLIPLSVAAFLVVLGVVAWIASSWTDQDSKKKTASVGQFEDLKLKEIFDDARKNKKDLDDLQAQMNQLKVASAAKIATIQQVATSKADIASVNDPSGAQAKAILADMNKQVSAERGALAAALRPLQDKASEVQKKIDSYDDRISQMNKKNQQVLDSQQKLFDLQKQQLVDDYEARLKNQSDSSAAEVARLKQERNDFVAALKAKQAEEIKQLILKYNPIITDQAVADELTATGTKPAVYADLVLPDRIASHSLISDTQQKTLADEVTKTKMLLAALKAVPYENSVPPLLNALDNAIADSLSGYGAYLDPLAAHMTDLDGQISQRDSTIADLQTKLTASTEQFARWSGDVTDYIATFRDQDGLIVDGKDAAGFLIVLKPNRAKDLADALAVYQKAVDAATAAAAADPTKPAKVIQPVNVAFVKDGIDYGERGTLAVTQAADGSWVGTILKVYDPKRPFRAFDKVVLQVPAKK
jgi:hypothetical protein